MTHHTARDGVKGERIRIEYVASRGQHADVLIKAINVKSFDKDT